MPSTDVHTTGSSVPVDVATANGKDLASRGAGRPATWVQIAASVLAGAPKTGRPATWVQIVACVLAGAPKSGRPATWVQIVAYVLADAPMSAGWAGRRSPARPPGTDESRRP